MHFPFQKIHKDKAKQLLSGNGVRSGRGEVGQGGTLGKGQHGIGSTLKKKVSSNTSRYVKDADAEKHMSSLSDNIAVTKK